MSAVADLLREAANLMRERASVATPGPWSQHTAEEAADTVIFAGREWITNIDNCPRVGEHMATPGGSICSDQAIPNGEHIASWHPAVALAVADWLAWVAAATEAIDGLADLAEQFGFERQVSRKRSEVFATCEEHALAVARAYLTPSP